jgi:hypothetical protein
MKPVKKLYARTGVMDGRRCIPGHGCHKTVEENLTSGSFAVAREPGAEDSSHESVATRHSSSDTDERPANHAWVWDGVVDSGLV